jgi:hypothetical protein
MNLIELTIASLALRKDILRLLTGASRPLTRTAAEGAPVGITAEHEGQWCRVGPYLVAGGRVRAYDWYRADTTTSWRLVEDLTNTILQSTYATIAALNSKANINSPDFTGTPTTTAPDPTDYSSRLATTKFAKDVASPGAILRTAAQGSPNGNGSAAGYTLTLVGNSVNDQSIQLAYSFELVGVAPVVGNWSSAFGAGVSPATQAVIITSTANPDADAFKNYFTITASGATLTISPKVGTPTVATFSFTADPQWGPPVSAQPTVGNAVIASFVGQLCRVGDDPYTWYRAATLTSWELVTNLDALTVGRTLSGNSTVEIGDYGKYLQLAGFTLGTGASQVNGQLLAQGPGMVTTNNHGTFRLLTDESATLMCLAANDLRVISISRKNSRKFFSQDTTPTLLESAPNDEWFNTVTLSLFVRYGNSWIEVSGGGDNFTIGTTAPVNAIQAEGVVVSGITSTTGANGLYEPTGTFGQSGFPDYAKGDYVIVSALYGDSPQYPVWFIGDTSFPGATLYRSELNSSYPTPDLVPSWDPVSGIGVVNISPEIAAPATPAPPHIRVAGGFLYVQEVGVWKKVALSNL